jgi:putative membrane protein
MKNYILAPVFLLFACFALHAQDTSRLGISPPQVQMDNDFVRNATQAGLSEIRLGQLAQQQSGSSEIRDYGKMMVTDHQKANDELSNLIRERGYRDIPTQPAINARNDYDKLSRLNGKEFDKAFVKQVIKEHEQTVKLFKEQAENGKDEQVRNWARNTLPTLERHLEHSHNLEKNQNK